MKVTIITRKMLHCFLISLALVLAVSVGITLWVGKDASRKAGASVHKLLPIYGVNTEEKKIALTFDCAWENSDTQVLLDILGANQISATFFTTGDWCERYPEDVKAFATAGHDVANHSYGHPHVASISQEKLIADTQKCDDIIEKLTGERPTLYRAPYGEYSDTMLSVFKQKLGHQVIQWDVDVSRLKYNRTAKALDGKIPGELCGWKEATIIEAEVCPDYTYAIIMAASSSGLYPHMQKATGLAGGFY